MQYGVGVHGAPPSLVRQMRSLMISTWYTPGASTSSWITSCLQGTHSEDPQIACWTQPVFQWALLVWDKNISHATLQQAWRRQVFRVLEATKPWA
eukprot:6806753-Pyramimonas_sp.AAC.1